MTGHDLFTPDDDPDGDVGRLDDTELSEGVEAAGQPEDMQPEGAEPFRGVAGSRRRAKIRYNPSRVAHGEDDL